MTHTYFLSALKLVLPVIHFLVFEMSFKALYTKSTSKVSQSLGKGKTKNDKILRYSRNTKDVIMSRH